MPDANIDAVPLQFSSSYTRFPETTRKVGCGFCKMVMFVPEGCVTGSCPSTVRTLSPRKTIASKPHFDAFGMMNIALPLCTTNNERRNALSYRLERKTSDVNPVPCRVVS